MTIKLPADPREKQYEDYIAACFISAGYFIETNMILKEESNEVLELDIVATPSGDNCLDKSLIEVKSGDWGFSDLFKLAGWMKYLEIITDAYIIHKNELDTTSENAFNKVGEAISVRHHQIKTQQDLEKMNYLIKPFLDISNDERELLHDMSWVSNIAQRIALKAFTDYRKSNADREFIISANEYQKSVKSSFFEKDPSQRASELYKAFQSCPHITRQIIRALSGENRYEKDIWGKINDTNDLLWIQYMQLMEHNARIWIIKNALDELARSNASNSYSLGFRNDISGWNLPNPDNYREGLRILDNNAYKYRIPFLLKVFTEVFGGFLLINNINDINLLSRFTDIPRDNVIDCLNILDVFFPTDRGWFYSQYVGNTDEIRVLKMVPGFLRGVGCFLRYAYYEIEKYESTYKDVGWLFTKWHNALYEVLEPELGVK